MAFEQNNSARDFETMLRSHLTQANRFASPCSEFDPELANAYFEGALSSRLRVSYEGHLASCATCRHAMIVLQKMSPVEVQVVSAEEAAPGWWQSITDVLRAPTWRLGLVAAASAIVIAVGVYGVRRSALTEPEASQAVSMASRSENVPTIVSTIGGISPTPTNRTEPRRESGEHRARGSSPGENTLPVIAAAPSASLVPTHAAPKLEGDLKAAAPPVAETQVAAAAQADRVQTESRKEEQRLDTFRAPPPAQVAQSQERQIDDKGARRLAPRESAKSRPKATPPPKSNEDEDFHPLIRKVRDKSFRFEPGGIWIDQEYKPEYRLQKTRLWRGTPDFDRVLSENPALAPFFDLGAVIVVWQGRVYEVHK